MLGRTRFAPAPPDLCCCSSSLVRSRWSLGSAYWQVLERDRLVPLPPPDHDSDRDAEPARRHLRSERDRRPRHARSTRAAGRRARSSSRRTERRATATELVRFFDLDETETATLREKLASSSRTWSFATDLEPYDGRPDPRRAGQRPAVRALALEPEPRRVYPQAGGGPDTTPGGAAARVRQSRRASASTAWSSATRRPLPGRRGSSWRIATRAAARSSSGPIVESAGAPGKDLRLTIDAGPAAARSSRSSWRPGSPTRPSACRLS